MKTLASLIRGSGRRTRQEPQGVAYRPARVYLSAAVRPVELPGLVRIGAGGWVEIQADATEASADVRAISYPPHRVARVEWLAEGSRQ